MRMHTVPAAVHIISVAADGRELWHFERGGNDPVEVPPGSGGLRIRFTTPMLRVPEKTRFRHRIHGLHDDWRDSGPDRAIAIGALGPGRYRFEAMAAGPEGNWHSPAATIRFRVHPHFWETLAFRISTSLAAAAAIVMVVRRWSLRRLRLKIKLMQREQHLERERSRIARDLHDDLGATLTEINFLGSLGLTNARTPLTRERLEGIVERTQRMAKSLDEIVWTVNPVNDTLESTVNAHPGKPGHGRHPLSPGCGG